MTVAVLLVLGAGPAWAQNGPAGPQAGPAQARLSDQVRQSLATLTRDVAAAQEYANLAAAKATGAAVRALGQDMIATAGQINESLTRLANRTGLAISRQMDAKDRGELDALARTNGQEFAAGFTAWVQKTYPQMITALEQLGSEDEFRQLAQAALPGLRTELAKAQQLAQAPGAAGAPTQAPEPNRPAPGTGTAYGR